MARSADFEKLSLSALLKLQAQVDAEVARRKRREARRLKSKAQEIAGRAGYSLAELYGRGSAKSAIKYRNPAKPGETWTGRGRKPNWLVEALRKGASLDSFSI